MTTTNSTKPGDDCPTGCGGRIQVTSTRIVFDTRVRYLGCRTCGYRPDDNVLTVPLADAPRRPAPHHKRKIATVAPTPIAQVGIGVMMEGVTATTKGNP
jgi:hypothetical protein